MNMLKMLIPLIILSPAMAIGAPKKAAKPATPKKEATLLSGSSSTGAGFNREALKGLSLFAAYDFANSVSSSGNGQSQTRDIDRAFQLGAQYEFSQFSPGLAAQVGGLYEFERTVQNSGDSRISTFNTFAELTAKLTPQVKLMGGLNYNFPSIKNAPGTSIKGKIGFQFGGSFLASENFAIDARYRIMEMETSGDQLVEDEFGMVTRRKASATHKVSGLILGGRYMF